jgi:hypothetical protein
MKGRRGPLNFEASFTTNTIVNRRIVANLININVECL